MDARESYADIMLNKPISKILLSVLFKAAIDFVSEANEERKRAKLQASDTPVFSKVLVNKNGGKPMNDESNDKDVSGFGPGLLLGSLIGGVIGAGLALWYAPQTGKKTQAKLKREATKLQKQMSKTANNLYTTAEEIASEAAERANGFTEQGREFVEEKASTLKKAVAR